MAAAGGWTEFYQKEDLTTRLRNILEDYPPGLTVFKEFLQNADDAGASTFSVCLDHTTYGDTGLLTPELAGWQGPALMFHNDSVFTDEDFQSVSHLGQSSKLHDETRIGRYGLGLNCAYHLTDLLTFVSAEQLVMFDPHGTFLPDHVLGLKTDYIKEDWTSQFPDQLRPYAWLPSPDAPPGTLFRLPLRTAANQERFPSKISATQYDVETLHELLLGFTGLAPESLLFLQHVTKIEVFERHPSAVSGQPPQTHKLYTVRVRGPSAELQAQRTMLKAAAKDRGEQKPRAVFDLVLEERPSTTDGSTASPAPPTAPPPPETSTQHWAVAVGLYGGHRELSASLQAPEWAGVAARLDAPAPGRAFCFLPLPIETGLQVHVNAAFALTSNRRSLWDAAGGELDKFGLKKAQWNRALLCDAIPWLYAHLLEHLTGRFPGWQPAERLWPVASHANGQFVEVCSRALEMLIGQGAKVFWSEQSGSFLPLKDCIFELADQPAGKALRVFLLHKASSQIVCPPTAVRDSLDEAGIKYKEMSNQYLSSRLTGLSLPRPVASEALAFILRHERPTSADYAALIGLKALPLANGKYGTFEKRKEKGRMKLVFATAEPEVAVTLLAACPEVVDPRHPCFGKLARRECFAATNVRPLEPEALLQLMPYVLPATWLGRSCVGPAGSRPNGGNSLDAQGGSTVDSGVKKKEKKAERKARLAEAARLKAWMAQHSKECCPEDVGLDVVLARLEVLWRFFEGLKANQATLRLFRDWPMVATTAGYIISLPYAESRGCLAAACLPTATTGLLERFGCLFAHQTCDATILDNLLLQPSDVLRALGASCLDGGHFSLDDSLALRKHIIAWCTEGIKDHSGIKAKCYNRDRIVDLPVFMTLGGTVCRNGHISTTSCDQPAEWSTWDELLAPIFPNDLLRCDGADVARVLQLAGVRRASLGQFLANFLGAKLNDGLELPQSACIRFLTEVGAVLGSKTSGSSALTLRAISAANIIVVGEGEGGEGSAARRDRPPAFFDPTEPAFQGLVEDSELLPTAYCTPPILGVLRRAGLRTLQDSRTFELAARKVAHSQSQAHSLLLLRCLRTFPNSWSPHQLYNITCIPFVVAHRFPGMALPLAVLRRCVSGLLPSADEGPMRTSKKRKNRGQAAIAAILSDELQGALDFDDMDGAPQRSNFVDVAESRTILSSLCAALKEEEAAEVPTATAAAAQSGTVVFVKLFNPNLFCEEAALGWTGASIIHPIFNPSPERRRKLCISGFPPPMVVDHLQTVVGEWTRGTEPRPPIGAMQAVALACLTRISVEVFDSRISSQRVVNALRDVPLVVMDDGEFSLAKNVCLDLDDDITPTARAAPAWCRPVQPLLRLIGSASVQGRAPSVVVSGRPPAEFLGKLVRGAFNDKELSDISFVAEGQEVFAHKLVLGLCSPVFKAMFSSGMAEHVGSKTTIREDDVSACAVEIMVGYCYSGKVDKVARRSTPPTAEGCAMVIEVMRLSDKYMLEHLRQTCEVYLARPDILDLYNVCDLLVHAHGCNAHQLLALCLFNIRRNIKFVGAMEQFALLPAELKAMVADM